MGEEYVDEDEDNPDGKRELDCEKVTNKCLAEMAFIGSYLFIILSFIVGITYSISYGSPKTIMIQFFIAWALDQAKSFPVQLFLYYSVILRFGTLENVELTHWDDREAAERGPEISLMQKMRKNVQDFLERPKIVDFILGMVILLCVVIFSELALAQQIEQVEVLGRIYYIINYILLTFFIIEIGVKLFAYGHLFLMEFINVFDSTIVILSYVMLILNLKVKVVGILRVLRLIKVIINLKISSDAKRAKKEFIKEQKRQGSQMASYVERVLDFFERLAKNENVDKILREDVEWAIDMISANKLY